jgi:hypothetical protein
MLPLELWLLRVRTTCHSFLSGSPMSYSNMFFGRTAMPEGMVTDSECPLIFAVGSLANSLSGAYSLSSESTSWMGKDDLTLRSAVIGQPV